MNKTMLLSSAVLALAIVGCQQSEPPLEAATPSVRAYDFKPDVDAGWPIQKANAQLVADLKKMTAGTYGQSFLPRNDPWALLPEERSFERSQTSERVLSESGSWRFDYVAPPETGQVETVEPQPYRRLAGVIVGESVLALIDMGDGRPLEIIRPGQRIPNSEWTVVSIDEDQAILRRTGNKLPRQIVVRLQSPLVQPGGGGTGAPGGPPGQGAGAPGGQGGRPGVGSGGGPSGVG